MIKIRNILEENTCINYINKDKNQKINYLIIKLNNNRIKN